MTAAGPRPTPLCDDNDVLVADINGLSGHLDACLDQLGHTDVSSLDWLRDFQAQQRAAVVAGAVADELERIADEDDAHYATKPFGRMEDDATGPSPDELRAIAAEWREGKR